MEITLFWKECLKKTCWILVTTINTGVSVGEATLKLSSYIWKVGLLAHYELQTNKKVVTYIEVTENGNIFFSGILPIIIILSSNYYLSEPYSGTMSGFKWMKNLKKADSIKLNQVANINTI